MLARILRQTLAVHQSNYREQCKWEIEKCGQENEKGVPAVTENKNGRGKTVYYGSFFNLDAARYLLGRYSKEQNLSPLFADLPKEIEVTRRSKGTQHYYFILNHQNETVTVKVGGGFYDLLEEKQSPASITLAPVGYKVLRKAR